MNIGESPKTKEVLTLLATGAFLSAAIIMPGLPAVLKLTRQWSHCKRNRLKQILKRFKEREIISISEKDGEQIITLTEKGKKKVLSYKFDELEIKSQNHWDKKWRVVIFDIPESMRKVRDIFREKLKEMGFIKLQESVFVHRYPCKEQIDFLSILLGIEKYISILRVDKIEGSIELK